jgi:uncharacterized protein YqiB (DUF1249 family)
MRKRYSIDLGAHIAECDANYARLQALAPMLCRAPVCANAEVRASNGNSNGDTASCQQATPRAQAFADWQATDIEDEGFCVELGDSAVCVVIKLIESSRYTTLVQFAQHPLTETTGFARTLAASAMPRMLVRLYHDARSAEVVEVRNECRFKEVYEYPNPKMRARDEKAQVNRFLGEYLAICLRYGLASPAKLAVRSS